MNELKKPLVHTATFLFLVKRANFSLWSHIVFIFRFKELIINDIYSGICFAKCKVILDSGAGISIPPFFILIWVVAQFEVSAFIIFDNVINKSSQFTPTMT